MTINFMNPAAPDRSILRGEVMLRCERLACSALRGVVRAVALAAATLFFGGSAFAAYPERNILIIVPFAPGGGSDAVARILSKHLTESLGRSVVVENRPGAGGKIGRAHV